uniref:Uncharacterized protein n=1 Tax=Trypanosoma vivax (strain Y486) TaxID=1055687 RepID=G0TW86_TRYVY|nr:conserved hypothetical protein, fragment [Trypanosoma vivax Y486]
MLTLRRIIPPSVAHILCPFYTTDETFLLAAVGSSLHVLRTVWGDSEGDSGNGGHVEGGGVCCSFVAVGDELNLGAVPIAVFACAYQCLWLAHDVLHHQNTWIILCRTSLHAGPLGICTMMDRKSLFACNINGTIVHCVVERGRRHTISIKLPSDPHQSSGIEHEKWLFNECTHVEHQGGSAVPFKRDIIEQADEELLLHYTVEELAEMKQKQNKSCLAPVSGSPPVTVSIQSHDTVYNDLSIAPLSVGQTGRDQQIQRDFCAFVTSNSDSIHIFDNNLPFSETSMAGAFSSFGTPYLVTSLPGYLLVLSQEGKGHVLTLFSVSSAVLLEKRCAMRVALSTESPSAALVLVPPSSEGEGLKGTVLWLLLTNGLLACIPLDLLQSDSAHFTVMDAPHLGVGDCEDCSWPIARFAGLPDSFRASSFSSFGREPGGAFLPYGVTRCHALLSDVSDSYVVNLVEHRVAGALLSRGSMTSACGGQSRDIITAYSKGVIERLSPGAEALMRLRASFKGAEKLFPLPHMSQAWSQALVGKEESVSGCSTPFYILVSTVCSSSVLCGTMWSLRHASEDVGLVLDESTLAVCSLPFPVPVPIEDGRRADVLTPASQPFFAQCTPTRINVMGKHTQLLAVAPELGCVSHACFCDHKWVALANGRRFAVARITGKGGVQVVLSECLSNEVSHITAWQSGVKMTPSNLSGHSSVVENSGDRDDWCIANCLWSREVVIWRVNREGVTAWKNCKLLLTAVVLLSFPLSTGIIRRKREQDSTNKCEGVGLVLVDKTAVALICGVDNTVCLSTLKDIDGGLYRMDQCTSIISCNTNNLTTPNSDSDHSAIPRFRFASLCGGALELLAVAQTGVIEEQLSVALASHTGGVTVWEDELNGDTSAIAGKVSSVPHCALAFYFPSVSFYVMVFSDGAHITLWALPEIPLQPAPPASLLSAPAALPQFRPKGVFPQPRKVPLLGPVVYQVTHSLKLPSVCLHSHSLARVIYLPLINTIVAMTDRNGDASLITTIDAESFHVMDALTLRVGEVAMCMEPLEPTGVGREDLVVIGTAVPESSSLDIAADQVNKAMAGRLVVVHARPLRISTYISVGSDTLQPGVAGNEGSAKCQSLCGASGIVDISVQRQDDNYLIAAACLDRVLVFRLSGFTLSLICAAETRAACTTVGLSYPFVSCGLHACGTQYMELLQEERIGCRRNKTRLGESTVDCAISSHLRSTHNLLVYEPRVTYSLKQCALEPAPLVSVSAQSVCADGFVRVDTERNVVVVSFRGPPANVVDATSLPVAEPIVGVEGGYCSAVVRCTRLPSCAQGVSVWRQPGYVHRSQSRSFVSWSDCSTALRAVGPALLFPCADGSLYCAREVPHAFTGSLCRFEQRVGELFDTSLSLSQSRTAYRGGGTGLHRTYHSVSHEASCAVHTTTRLLLKQRFVFVDVLLEFFLTLRLAGQPDVVVTEHELRMAEKKKVLLYERLLHVWDEYAGELNDLSMEELLYLW